MKYRDRNEITAQILESANGNSNSNSNNNDQSVFAWEQVGRFQSNTNINDSGLIQQIKSILPKQPS